MKYQIYYFSATGNNQHCADLIKQNLISKKHKVKITYVHKNTVFENSEHDTAIFIFPTYSFIAPATFRHFVKKLPKIKNKKAVVLTADGGGCYFALEDMKILLKRKRYEVFLTHRIKFPDNWQQVYPAADDQKLSKEIKAGEKELKNFLAKLNKEKSEHYKISKFALTISAITAHLFLLYGRRILGKMYIADDDCNFCGICAKKCPSNVIKLNKSKRQKPYWNISCIACNRCINICPKKAVNSSLLRVIILLTLIITLSIAGIYSFVHFVAPQISFEQNNLNIIINTAAIFLILIITHFLPISFLDKFFLYKIQNIPSLKRFFNKTFTKHFKRYMRPKYRPETPK